MITVIGNNGCSHCIMTKNILTQKGIEFTYQLFNNLSKAEQDELLIRAQDTNMLNFPIIIQNNEIVTLEDIKD